MDPFSIATGALGTFGVALQTTQALIQLVGDVQGAPEEVTAASKEAESFAGVLKNIQDQVDNGTNELPYFWPSTLTKGTQILSICLDHVAREEGDLISCRHHS
jgi:hypothetical protein